MAEVLTKEQQNKLRAVLSTVLNGFTVVKNMTDKEQESKSNERLLKSFLSAKKVEGCSEKTLAYYESTLAKLLESIDKGLSEVTTDDVLPCHFQGKPWFQQGDH